MSVREYYKVYIDLGLSVIPVEANKRPKVTWKAYENRLATKQEYSQWDSIALGVVTGPVSNLAVIDIDIANVETINELLELIGKDNRITEATDSQVMEAFGTLVVKTPRGGYHLWYKYPNYELGNTVNLIKGVDVRGIGGYIIAPPSQCLIKNTNELGKYKFLNANTKNELKEKIASIPEYPIREIAIEMEPDEYFTEGRRDIDLFTTACCLIDGKAKARHVEFIVKHLANACGLGDVVALEKIASAYKKTGNKDISIAEQVRDFIKFSFGWFTTQEVYNNLSAIHPNEKLAIRVELHHQFSKSLIERDKKRNATYRRIVTDNVTEMELGKPASPEYPVYLPLNLNSLVSIRQKNIIILAGVSNAGKTAFLLETARYNNNVHYFNSEMSEDELTHKLSNSPNGWNDYNHVKFYERDSNFADVIRPNGINIIDFLEIYDQHYLIGEMLKDIHDRLDEGIAIIAIQKDPRKDFGVGGSVTMQKSRLYINIDNVDGNPTAKIIKAKNWNNPEINPNRLECGFRIKDKGLRIAPSTHWHRDNQTIKENTLDYGM